MRKDSVSFMLAKEITVWNLQNNVIVDHTPSFKKDFFRIPETFPEIGILVHYVHNEE